MQKYLGLDISTSCTGWAVTSIDDCGNTIDVELGYIKLDKYDDLIQKAKVVSAELSAINKKHQLSRIYIEENMQAFRPGASSAQTLVTLAKFNGIVMFLCNQVTEITPVSVNVNHARKSLGINLKREKVCGISTKSQIHTWVSAHSLMKSFEWPTKVMSSGPRKGLSVVETCSYDMADAFVIALAGPIVIK